LQLRENNLRMLTAEPLDVLIVGCGINGAIAASALAAQGARVGAIDRGDFGGETSQESSNLVWGGIKYLESYEFKLVRKLCMSRNELILSYPSNVREIRFYTSLAKSFRWPRVMMFAGTWLYWLIGSGFTRMPRLLSRRNMQNEEPMINTANLQGGVEYSDAYLVDNDARFVWSFMRSALDHGAITTNYVEAQSFKRDETGVWQVQARDVEQNKAITIHAKVVINAAGPWVDQLNQHAQQPSRHRHVFSKGIHLIVPRISKSQRVLTFFADDGRMFFVIPMGTVSCVGTTDTRVDQPETFVTAEDRKFVLENINKRLQLPRPLEFDDIIAERCGVRPLVVKSAASANQLQDWTSMSRKHVIEADPDRGWFSIFGGKLTDCLNVGREISEWVSQSGVRLPHRETRWFGEPNPEVRAEFMRRAELMRLDQLTAKESSEKLSTRLWRRYGWRALSLLEDIRNNPAMAEVLIKGTEYIRCELHHAAEHEMVTRLEDFLRRRSKIALVEKNETIRIAPGLQEACEILFPKNAREKLAEYFGQDLKLVK
jgi:glycerol-3-phosphate dehydrogenase